MKVSYQHSFMATSGDRHNMIQIERINSTGKSCLELDFYVILRYVVEPTLRRERIVGYVGDHHRNISEIKIDRESGEIYSFVVLGSDQTIHRRADNPFTFLPKRRGTPIVDLGSLVFQESKEFGHPAHFDNPAIIHCSVVAERSISVIFDTANEPTNLIDAGGVNFLLSDRTLVGVLTRPLARSELDLFDEWAQRMQKPLNS